MPDVERTLTAKFVKENDLKHKSRYSEFEPTWVIGSLYVNTHALRQAFGHIPEKFEVTIKEIAE